MGVLTWCLIEIPTEAVLSALVHLQCRQFRMPALYLHLSELKNSLGTMAGRAEGGWLNSLRQSSETIPSFLLPQQCSL